MNFILQFLVATATHYSRGISIGGLEILDPQIPSSTVTFLERAGR